jgi:hypothetical protein
VIDPGLVQVINGEISKLNAEHPDGVCLPRSVYSYQAFYCYREDDNGNKDLSVPPYYWVQLKRFESQKCESQDGKCRLIFDSTPWYYNFYYVFSKFPLPSYKSVEDPINSITNHCKEMQTGSSYPLLKPHYLPLTCCQTSPTPNPGVGTSIQPSSSPTGTTSATAAISTSTPSRPIPLNK